MPTSRLRQCCVISCLLSGEERVRKCGHWCIIIKSINNLECFFVIGKKKCVFETYQNADRRMISTDWTYEQRQKKIEIKETTKIRST